MGKHLSHTKVTLFMYFKIRSQNPFDHLCMGLDFKYYSEIPPDLKDRMNLKHGQITLWLRLMSILFSWNPYELLFSITLTIYRRREIVYQLFHLIGNSNIGPGILAVNVIKQGSLFPSHTPCLIECLWRFSFALLKHHLSSLWNVGIFQVQEKKNILGSQDIDNPKLVSNPLHLVKQLCTSKNVIVRGKSFPWKFLNMCMWLLVFKS